ncbi:lipopolysaccharide biosynthesis protein [Pseudonocardia sp.]|uniref:lipopolysaccharide biosynthesis protein n=1 Tax=Pseudonocardia sp. TaxID=60912 RepID=UPI0031FD18ED
MSLLYVIRLHQSPDFTGDEALYAIAGRSIADHGDIAWGTPVFVHPPGYFLLAGLWLKLFTHGGSDVLGDIYALRSLSALLSCLAAALAGALAAALASPRIRVFSCIAVTLLVALNPISVRFGRMVLIEPMALCLGLAAVLLAWRVRRSRTALYIASVGLVGGLALLTKSVTAFIIVTPLVTALLSRLLSRWKLVDGGARRGIRREFGALAVAGGIWLAFPMWAAFNGEALGFLSEQTISIRRLLGLLQLSGLNRPGVSAIASLLGTLGQYAGAYLLLLAGGLSLICAVLRARPWSERTVYLLTYCTLAFATVGYNVLFGQSNEQLLFYAFPAAAIAVVAVRESTRGAGAGPRTARHLGRVVVALVLVAVAASGYSWVRYQLVTPDDGTVATRDFIASQVPACAVVNASGDQFRWGYVVRTNPVAAYHSGPEALAAGVHVFILSTKDSQFLYGNSNPALDAWVRGAGTELFGIRTHTYGDLSVWRVGDLPRNGTTAGCAMPLPGAVDNARMAPFLATLLTAVALLIAVTSVLLRRRRPTSAGPTTDNSAGDNRVGDTTTPEELPVTETEPPDGPTSAGRKPVRAAWLTAALGLSAVVNYAYTLLLTHGLAPAEYAVFAAGQGILLILGTVGAVAVPWVLAREIVLQDGHPDRQRAAVNLAFWINVGAGAVLAAAVAGVTLSFGSPATAIVMAATTFLLAVGSTALGFLQGTQNVILLGALVLGEFAVKLVVGAALVFVFGLGGTAALSAATVGALVPLAGCILTCRPAIGRPRRVSLSPGLWRAAGRIGGLQSIVALFTAVDTVLVAALASTHAMAGLYQAAATLGRSPLFISVALATAVFPVLMANRGSVTHRADAIRTLAIASIFLLVALSTVPERVVGLVFPAEFVSLQHWLPIVALLGVGLAAMNLVTSFVQTEDRVGSAQKRLALGFVAHVALLVAGAEVFGVIGLAWGAVIGVWVTAALLAVLSTERRAVVVAARQIATVRNGLVLGALVAGLALVEQPFIWLACAAVGGLAACFVAFPELAGLVSRERRRPEDAVVDAELTR